MRLSGSAVLQGVYRDESGQALPVIVIMMMMMLGMAGIAVDVGHVFAAQRELQSSADASALAGATAMAGATTHPLATTASGVQAVATNYSSLAGKQNAYNDLTNVTMVSGYPLLKCLTTFQAQGISCVGFVPDNAVQVKLQADVPMYFAKLFGYSKMTIHAISTAVKGGGPSRPYNIAIIVDSTGSMVSHDWYCDPTGHTSKLQCSLNGIALLLHYLDPCGASQSTCTVSGGQAVNSVARVSIYTFPALVADTVSNDYNCGTSPPTSTVYNYPPAGAVGYYPTGPTFRVVPFSSDYRTSDTATSLNSSSDLTIAVGGVPGCTGMTPPNNVTYENTYYAPPMYAAEAALLAAQASHPGSENVMIIVGDGDANTPQTNGSTVIMPSPATANGNYPSWEGECGQAITAAQSFTNTVVYTVAYGPPASGCWTDQAGAFSPGSTNSSNLNVQPCAELSSMATYSWTFFSDNFGATGTGTCDAGQAESSLAGIFQQIAGDLTEAHVVSDSTP
jgi:Flp pilus assembly protein TadG